MIRYIFRNKKYLGLIFNFNTIFSFNMLEKYGRPIWVQDSHPQNINNCKLTV